MEDGLIRSIKRHKAAVGLITALLVPSSACEAPRPVTAPPPLNEHVRGSVVLREVPTWISAYCQRAANKLRFQVPCPTLAPRRGTWIPCKGTDQRLGGSGCFLDGTFVLEKVFPASKGYEGLPGPKPGGHMTLWAVRGQPQGKGCNGFGRIEGRSPVQGVFGTWFACSVGPSIDSSHLVLQWRTRGVTQGVGFHGLTRVNLQLARNVAKHLRIVSPSAMTG